MVTERSKTGYEILLPQDLCNLPSYALQQWRISTGMEPQHLAREIGFDIREVKRLEAGHMGLVGREWVAGELLSLGAPKWAVEALQDTPDCNHTQTTTQHITPIHGEPYDLLVCASCGRGFGRI